jgi:hypothetical protein
MAHHEKYEKDIKKQKKIINDSRTDLNALHFLLVECNVFDTVDLSVTHVFPGPAFTHLSRVVHGRIVGVLPPG